MYETKTVIDGGNIRKRAHKCGACRISLLVHVKQRLVALNRVRRCPLSYTVDIAQFLLSGIRVIPHVALAFVNVYGAHKRGVHGGKDRKRRLVLRT